MKQICKKITPLSLVKKDTGGLHFNGRYYYTSPTGITISIFLMIGIITIIIAGLNSIGRYLSSNTFLVNKNKF